MCKTEYADVFLSHHVGTMGEHAKKLYEELCRRSIKTFICTSMKPGADFRQTITVNAVKCKLFVAFINEAWACSEECISEFNCALSGYNQAGSPKILPIVIGGFDWIDVVKYPNVFYIKANTNCCLLQGDNWDKVFQEIISTIESHLVKDEHNSGSSAVNVTPGLQQGASQTSTEGTR